MKTDGLPSELAKLRSAALIRRKADLMMTQAMEAAAQAGISADAMTQVVENLDQYPPPGADPVFVQGYEDAEAHKPIMEPSNLEYRSGYEGYLRMHG